MSTIEELMTTDIAYCVPETALGEIARKMATYDCGEIPVFEDGEKRVPIGVVTDRDIVCRILARYENPLQGRAEDCMSTPCVTVAHNASVEDCCRVLEQNQIRRAPVIDDEGQCCGMISLADLVRERSNGAAMQSLVREVSAHR